MSDAMRKAGGPVIALAGALALSSLIMLAFHANPLRAFEALFQGALGSEQGISQETLACQADLHRTQVGAIDNIEHLARALDVDIRAP